MRILIIFTLFFFIKNIQSVIPEKPQSNEKLTACLAIVVCKNQPSPQRDQKSQEQRECPCCLPRVAQGSNVSFKNTTHNSSIPLDLKLLNGPW